MKPKTQGNDVKQARPVELDKQPLSWWLKSFSPSQLWGLLGSLIALLGSAFTGGFWMGSNLTHTNKAPVVEKITATPAPMLATQALPDGLIKLDVEILKVLAEPHEFYVRIDYLSGRLNASPMLIEAELLELSHRDLLLIFRSESGELMGAMSRPAGLKILKEHNLL